MKDAQVQEIFKSLIEGRLTAPAAVDALVALGMNRDDAADQVAIETGQSNGDVVDLTDRLAE